jgi:DNA-binding response OmpR family regulator
MILSRFDTAIEGLVILIADGNSYTRKLTRAMLVRAKAVYEVGDGLAALEAIRAVSPDIMIMDWELPILSGRDVMRAVRSPDTFPRPDLPVIMLTDVGDPERVREATYIGVHEVLVKPISPKTLQDRMLGILVRPRPMVWVGDSYVPQPRRHADFQSLLNGPEAATA